MHSLSANEAKTQFGDMLLKAQREPVQISRNGKPVAVVISAEEYQAIEAMKQQFLQEKIARARNDIANGQLTDGETFFDQLLD
ncbi:MULTISPECIES: type II toxin-antitoxin system Phd/YefM family antitoxin [Pantoea]|jgi:prevent-host-death family protein|uniref:Antitoxin n=1 Tax=Pantoea endophytica TaxID=92488 RepID=A0ABX4SPY0_9GAMM|nr:MULTISPECIES: type II toxin-antitoxin system Phd/YefM family antitoxin [Pantoea]MBD9660750.1 type II toxin-antitoxin system Phd/YefM family antitoxin [Pantoea sp. PNT03]MBY4953796.1 type II toxin-antitoxin system Phd/YefM family antitoxin [Pantoea sp. DY-17]MDR6348900.1 prevent-host-death family protein [Pantoea sp. SORGH_AS_0659]PLR23109.1 antitoxin [Pantoea endophytica]PYG48823.1 prevent-host-death family protein [Pantoea sp. AG1095]